MQFKSKINIIRISNVKDDQGSDKELKAVIYLNLPCRINWSRGSEKIQFDKTTYYRDGKIYCRVVSVTTDDRVVCNEVEYEIVNVVNVDESNRQMVLEIKLIQ